MQPYTGSCLCGGIAFQVRGSLPPIQVCHCRQCRKAQGTPFATNTPVEEAKFELVSGRELITEYESSPGKFHAYTGSKANWWPILDDLPCFEGVADPAGKR